MHAEPVLAPRELEHHRCAGLLREHRRNQVGVLVLVLVAEVAAHVLADDPHLVVGEAEVARGVVLAVGDAAGRGVERELVAFPVSQARARLHLGVVHERGGVAIFEDLVGRGEPLVDVPPPRLARHGLVARVRRQVAFGPDLGRIRLERLFGIDDEREHFVVDGDEIERFFGHMPIDGGDGRDRVADEPDGVVEDVAALRRDFLDVVVVLRAAGNRSGAPPDRCVVVRDDRFDARQRGGLRRIDAADAGVRMRTAQDARVQHARQADVARIGRLAGDTFDGVDPCASSGRPFSAVQSASRTGRSLRASVPASSAPADAARTASTIAL